MTSFPAISTMTQVAAVFVIIGYTVSFVLARVGVAAFGNVLMFPFFLVVVLFWFVVVVFFRDEIRDGRGVHSWFQRKDSDNGIHNQGLQLLHFVNSVHVRDKAFHGKDCQQA